MRKSNSLKWGKQTLTLSAKNTFEVCCLMHSSVVKESLTVQYEGVIVVVSVKVIVFL
jgi:hypothetical protein